MKIVKGNKTIDLAQTELEEKVNRYKKIIIDLGTGDGRFIYKSAVDNADNFYIGIDPSETQLKIYSKKANKKKLENILFVIASIELMPIELTGLADNVFVQFPWGTLLQYFVSPTEELINKTKNLLKKAGCLEIIFGYSEELEPSETERLNLPKLSEDHIRKSLIPLFEHNGFQLTNFEKLENPELKNIETSWGKKLSFGKMRGIYKLQFQKL